MFKRFWTIFSLGAPANCVSQKNYSTITTKKDVRISLRFFFMDFVSHPSLSEFGVIFREWKYWSIYSNPQWIDLHINWFLSCSGRWDDTLKTAKSSTEKEHKALMRFRARWTTKICFATVRFWEVYHIELPTKLLIYSRGNQDHLEIISVYYHKR